MRSRTLALVLSLLAVLAGGHGPEAGAAPRLRVVASLPDLKALTEAVGGDLVEVDSLARPDQNPHDIEVRPSLMVKLRRADPLVRNGLDGDPWVEPLVQGSGNGGLLRGRPGHVDVSPGIPVLGVPAGPVDRSRGDVHPEGNPHFTLDPASAAVVTGHILEGLARAAPGQRAALEGRRREFLSRLDAALGRWQETLAFARGTPVAVYHDTWLYFLDRFRLTRALTVEDRPGIPPSPAHVATVIRRMRAEAIRVLVLEPWADRRLAERVAREGGARVVVLAPAVGAAPGAGSYLDLFEHNVRLLAEALRSTP
jgi:ABC-type Zn uptake system ZnuABC Zn-binding protein ZnuA